MDDRLIIDLLFSRSEKAIAALIEKYENICRKVSSNILRDRRDIEECINDTWLGVWNTVPPEHPDPLSAYVVRIVKNCSMRRQKYLNAQKRNINLEQPLEEMKDFLPNIIRDDEDSELIIHTLNSFLEGLKQKDRLLFVKRYWYFETIEDIANELGISQRNSRTKLFRLRNKFKALLESEGVEL